ncbi:MAG: hypothetical protein ACM3SS_19655 [Rhodospirillaceae bacterium]
MRPTKGEIAAGFDHWQRLYGPPKNKTRAGQGDGSDKVETGKAFCGEDTTTRDHTCASLLPAPVLDDSYDVEVKLYEPLRRFREAGRALLPLVLRKSLGEAFGRHYFVCTPSGIPLFDSEDEFSARLVLDAVTRAIKGAAE